MIFPDVRLSDLKREAEEKRIAFQRSRDELFQHLREESKPATFLKRHPSLVWGWVAVFLSFFPLSRLFGKVIPKGKSFISKVIHTRWAWRFLTAVAPLAMQGTVPLATKGFHFFLRKAFKSQQRTKAS